MKEIIQREIGSSNEVIAPFTRWSAVRSLGKPIIAIFCHMKVQHLEKSGQGEAMLKDINVLQLNDIGSYFAELAVRVKGAEDV